MEKLVNQIKQLSFEELQKLSVTIQELLTKKQQDDEKVLWSHSCSGSSKHHIGKYKHYAKAVTAIDLNSEKINGYAIKGKFLPNAIPYDQNEVKIPGNTLVYEVCSSSKTEVYYASDPSNVLYSFSGRVSYSDLEAIDKILKNN